MVIRVDKGVEILDCPRCQSAKTVRHGFIRNVNGKWQRRKCQDCGHTFYENKLDKEQK